MIRSTAKLFLKSAGLTKNFRSFYSSGIAHANVVTFEYKELLDPHSDFRKQIEQAYGPYGVGLALVKNIPKYDRLRKELLPLAQKLSNLPKPSLESLEDKESLYSVGWSHGKEQFLGKYDFSKGSFYANPLVDHPPSTSKHAEDHSLEIARPNRWPSQDLPDFEQKFKDLGRLMCAVGVDLARHIDHFIESNNSNYERGKLRRILSSSLGVKARLLHYFPIEKGDSNDVWCGWHNDHGSLTALTSSMYLNREGREVNFNSEETGLFAKNRYTDIVKVVIPPNMLAFQIGEATQIHSGGVVEATPHYVKRGKELVGTGISRNTLAVFMQPDNDELLMPPAGVSAKSVTIKKGYKIEPLEKRWKEGDTFAKFAKRSFQNYL